MADPNVIFAAQTANGAGTTVSVPSSASGVTIDCYGNWGAATVVTASIITPAVASPGCGQADTWTADDSKFLNRPGPFDLILTVSGADGSTDLDAYCVFHK